MPRRALGIDYLRARKAENQRQSRSKKAAQIDAVTAVSNPIEGDVPRPNEIPVQTTVDSPKIHVSIEGAQSHHLDSRTTPSQQAERSNGRSERYELRSRTRSSSVPQSFAYAPDDPLVEEETLEAISIMEDLVSRLSLSQELSPAPEEDLPLNIPVSPRDVQGEGHRGSVASLDEQSTLDHETITSTTIDTEQVNSPGTFVYGYILSGLHYRLMACWIVARPLIANAVRKLFCSLSIHT